jgi:hypothetical protein
MSHRIKKNTIKTSSKKKKVIRFAFTQCIFSVYMSNVNIFGKERAYYVKVFVIYTYQVEEPSP